MTLKEIEQALSKVTEGPWFAIKDPDCEDEQTHSICSMGGEHAKDCPTEEPWKDFHCHECVVYETYIKADDAAFIAKAPEYVAWLISEVKRLEQTISLGDNYADQ